MAGELQIPPADEQYKYWQSNILILYDWFTNHSLKWPSLSCRWGRHEEEERLRYIQRFYMSAQTDDSHPNPLIIGTIKVVKKRVADEKYMKTFDVEERSAFVTTCKTILHPGEVNRIRELPLNRNIVATHTDSPNVFIWNVEAQENRTAVLGAIPSTPDLTLTGHVENADFALAMCPIESYVLSGGKDTNVVLWHINDHMSSLAANQKHSGNPTTVGPRGIFKGHTNTVEDVQFNPSSPEEFCSVGDDSCLILWDERTGRVPVEKVEMAHNADIHCVDWNCEDKNYILTGSADNTIRLYDRRNLTFNGVASPLHIFEGHTGPISCVQWSRAGKFVFGSASDDWTLNVWDFAKIGRSSNEKSSSPPGLLFRHQGHRGKVVDFHWNAEDPWLVVSSSDDGTLQIWRIIDFIYDPEDQVIAELETHKGHIPECSSRSREP